MHNSTRDVFEATLHRCEKAGTYLEPEDFLYPKGRGALANRPYYPGFRECGDEVFECGNYKKRVRVFAHVLSAVAIGLPPGAGSPDRVYHAPDVEYIEILPSTFLMGSQENDSSFRAEYPQHRVRFHRPFLVARTPVTQRVWEGWFRFASRFFPNEIEGLTARPARFKIKDENDPDDNVGLRPVEAVSWADCVRMLRVVGLRLPSEAQWECAARGGSPDDYCFGNDVEGLKDYGWYYSNARSRTHAVAKKQPNAYGLYDVHGNVWEWCQDEYHEDYEGAPNDGSAWVDSDDPFETNKVDPERIRQAFERFRDEQDCYQYTNTTEEDEDSSFGGDFSSDPFSVPHRRTASTGAVAGTSSPGTAGPRTGTGTIPATGTATSASDPSLDELEVDFSSDPFSVPHRRFASTGAVAGATAPGSAGPRTGTTGRLASGTSTSASAPSLNELVRSDPYCVRRGGSG